MINGIFLFGAGAFAVVAGMLSAQAQARVPLGVLCLLGTFYLGLWGAWGLVSSALSVQLLRIAPLYWTVTLVTNAVQLALGVVFLLGAIRFLRSAPLLRLRGLLVALGVAAVLCGVANLAVAFLMF